MKKRKIYGLILAGAMVMTALSACGAPEAAEETLPEHVHVAGGAWQYNAAEHWQLCECGEEVRTAHELGDDGVNCTVCGSEIWDNGDGSYTVHGYSEQGDLISMITYDADGNKTEDYLREMEYDAEGNPLRAKVYYGGVFSEEVEYGLAADGSYMEMKSTYHNEDGSYYTNEYDENGNLTLMASYTADGSKEIEQISEYAVDGDGNYYEAVSTSVYYEMGNRYTAEYNEFGDQIAVITADLDGNVQKTERMEYGYDDDRNHTWKKTYINDILTEEIPGYITIETEDYTARVPESEIHYNADGTKKVLTPNEIGDVGMETYYNADGTVSLTITYEYEFFEDGNRKSFRTYEDGCLVRDAEYAMDEESGFSYEAKVTEFEKTGEIIAVTEFDADGNEISG